MAIQFREIFQEIMILRELEVNDNSGITPQILNAPINIMYGL